MGFILLRLTKTIRFFIKFLNFLSSAPLMGEKGGGVINLKLQF